MTFIARLVPSGTPSKLSSRRDFSHESAREASRG